MSRLRRWWAQTAPAAMLATGDSTHPHKLEPRTALDWFVDTAAFIVAAAIGVDDQRFAAERAEARIGGGGHTGDGGGFVIGRDDNGDLHRAGRVRWSMYFSIATGLA